MSTTPWTARVRSAVHQGPSARSWSEICRALDEADDPVKLEGMVGFVREHTSGWPATLRIAPVSWWVEAVTGRSAAKLSLARGLVIDGEALRGLRGARLAHALADHAATRQLLHLSVIRGELGDAGAAILAASPRITNLESLALPGNRISDAGALALAGDPQGPAGGQGPPPGEPRAGGAGAARGGGLRALSTLDLSWNDLGPRGLAAILASPRLPGLRALSIAGTHLGPEGAELIARSPGVARLAVLDLSECGLDDRAAAALAASPYLRGLVELDLRGNTLDPGGLDRLRGTDVRLGPASPRRPTLASSRNSDE